MVLLYRLDQFPKLAHRFSSCLRHLSLGIHLTSSSGLSNEAPCLRDFTNLQELKLYIYSRGNLKLSLALTQLPSSLHRLHLRKVDIASEYPSGWPPHLEALRLELCQFPTTMLEHLPSSLTMLRIRWGTLQLES